MSKTKDPGLEPQDSFDDDWDNSADDLLSGLDEFTFDEEAAQKERESRSPTEKFASSITSIAKSAGKSALPSMALGISNAVASAVPGVGRGFAGIKTAAASTNELLREATKGVQPVVTETARATKKLINQSRILSESKFGQSLLNRISQFAGDDDEDNYQASETESREGKITNTLSEIFATQIEQNEENRQTSTVNRIIDQKISSVRHGEQLGILGDIRSSMFFQSAFMRSTLTAYMKKDLELKYRHLFIAEDTLKMVSNSAVMMQERLDSIVHNTALPDSNKLQLNENLSKTLREKFATKITDRIGAYTSLIGKNINEKFVAPFLSNVRMLNGLGDSIEAVNSLGGGPNAMQEVAGSMLGNYATKPIGERFAKKLLSNVPKELLNKLSVAGDNFKVSAVEFLERLRKGEFGDSLPEVVNDALTDILPSIGDKTSFDFSPADTLEKGAVLTNKTILTIEEIIPNYLAAQTQFLEIIATGDSSVGKKYWDYETGTLTSKQTLRDKFEADAFGTKEMRLNDLSEDVGKTAWIAKNTASSTARGDEIRLSHKALAEDIERFKTNIALEPDILFISKSDIDELGQIAQGAEPTSTVLKLGFDGIRKDNREPVANWLYTLLTDENNEYNNIARNAINSDILRIKDRSGSRFREAFAKYERSYGHRDITESYVAGRDKSGVRLNIPAIRQRSNQLFDDTDTQFKTELINSIDNQGDAVSDTSITRDTNSKIGKKFDEVIDKTTTKFVSDDRFKEKAGEYGDRLVRFIGDPERTVTNLKDKFVNGWQSLDEKPKKHARGGTFEFSKKANRLIAKFLDSLGGTVNEETSVMDTTGVAGEAGKETIIPHKNTPRAKSLVIDAVRGIMGNRVADKISNILSSPETTYEKSEEPKSENRQFKSSLGIKLTDYSDRSEKDILIEQLVVLKEIAQQGAMHGFVPSAFTSTDNHGKKFDEKLGDLITGTAQGAKHLVSSAIGGATHLTTGAFKTISGIKPLTVVKNALLAGKDFAQGTFDLASDIYRSSDLSSPLVTAKDIVNRRLVYIDKNGEQQPVTSIKDIKGEIRWANIPENGTKAGQVAISLDDIHNGLSRFNGKPLGNLFNKLGDITRGIAGVAKSGISSAFSVPKNIFTSSLNLASKIARATFAKADPFIDVYVINENGELERRLNGLGIKTGRYFIKTARGSKLLKSAYEISGEVYELDHEKVPRVLITEDDIRNGLFNAAGDKLGRFAGMSIAGTIGSLLISGAASALGTAGKLAKKGLGKLGSGLKGIVGAGGSVLSGVSEFVQNVFGSITGTLSGRKDLEEIVGERLDKIYSFLETRFAARTVDLNDKDGDGDRDGSYTDLLKKKQEKAKARSNSRGARSGKPTGSVTPAGTHTDTQSTDNGNSLLGRASDFILDKGTDLLGDKLGKIKDLGKAGLGKAAGAAGRLGSIAGGAGGLITRGMASIIPALTAGAASAGTLASGAAGVLGSAAAGLGSIGGTLSASLGALASNPIGWAVAAGLAGYGIYKVFSDSDITTKWKKLRYAAYGSYELADQLEDFEEEIWDLWQSGGKEPSDKQLTQFGESIQFIDSGFLGFGKEDVGLTKRKLKYLREWFGLRFAPVFTTYAHIVNTLKEEKDTDFPDIDDIPERLEPDAYEIFNKSISKISFDPKTKPLNLSIKGFTEWDEQHQEKKTDEKEKPTEHKAALAAAGSTAVAKTVIDKKQRTESVDDQSVGKKTEPPLPVAKQISNFAKTAISAAFPVSSKIVDWAMNFFSSDDKKENSGTSINWKERYELYGFTSKFSQDYESDIIALEKAVARFLATGGSLKSIIDNELRDIIDDLDEDKITREAMRQMAIASTGKTLTFNGIGDEFRSYVQFWFENKFAPIASVLASIVAEANGSALGNSIDPDDIPEDKQISAFDTFKNKSKEISGSARFRLDEVGFEDWLWSHMDPNKFKDTNTVGGQNRHKNIGDMKKRFDQSVKMEFSATSKAHLEGKFDEATYGEAHSETIRKNLIETADKRTGLKPAPTKGTTSTGASFSFKSAVSWVSNFFDNISGKTARQQSLQWDIRFFFYGISDKDRDDHRRAIERLENTFCKFLDSGCPYNEVVNGTLADLTDILDWPSLLEEAVKLANDNKVSDASADELKAQFNTFAEIWFTNRFAPICAAYIGIVRTASGDTEKISPNPRRIPEEKQSPAFDAFVAMAKGYANKTDVELAPQYLADFLVSQLNPDKFKNAHFGSRGRQRKKLESYQKLQEASIEKQVKAISDSKWNASESEVAAKYSDNEKASFTKIASEGSQLFSDVNKATEERKKKEAAAKAAAEAPDTSATGGAPSVEGESIGDKPKSNIPAPNVTGKESLAKKIWDYFTGKGWSEEGVAGMMGNLQKESGMEAVRKQAMNGKELRQDKDRSLSMAYAKKADEDPASFTNPHSVGFGLAQWTTRARKNDLLSFAHGKGKSVGDEDVQIAFLDKELEKGDVKGRKHISTKTLNKIKKSTDVEEATELFMKGFERPADQSQREVAQRSGFAKHWYDKLATPANAAEAPDTSATGGAPSVEGEAAPNVEPATSPDITDTAESKVSGDVPAPAEKALDGSSPMAQSLREQLGSSSTTESAASPVSVKETTTETRVKSSIPPVASSAIETVNKDSNSSFTTEAKTPITTPVKDNEQIVQSKKLINNREGSVNAEQMAEMKLTNDLLKSIYELLSKQMNSVSKSEPVKPTTVERKEPDIAEVMSKSIESSNKNMTNTLNDLFAKYFGDKGSKTTPQQSSEKPRTNSFPINIGKTRMA